MNDYFIRYKDGATLEVVGGKHQLGENYITITRGNVIHLISNVNVDDITIVEVKV